MKILTGDLIALGKGDTFDVIVHGCNCFCVMGAGLAKAIRSEFPEVYRADQGTEAGLAGGDWERIAAIINEELAGEDHSLVVLD